MCGQDAIIAKIGAVDVRIWRTQPLCRTETGTTVQNQTAGTARGTHVFA
jgi:hypothetical protein